MLRFLRRYASACVSAHSGESLMPQIDMPAGEFDDPKHGFEGPYVTSN